MQMLDAQRVFQPDAAEMLRRKMGDARKLQRFFLREGIAHFDGAVIVDPDDVSRVGRFDIGPVLRHENRGVGQGNLLVDAVMKHAHAPLELARADSHKRDAVAVRRIHVGLDFKNKSGKILFARINLPRGRGTGNGRRSDFHKGVEQFPDAEIIDGAAEKNRRLSRLQVFSDFKGIGCAGEQGDFFAELRGLAVQQFIKQSIGQIADHDAFVRSL